MTNLHSTVINNNVTGKINRSTENCSSFYWFCKAKSHNLREPQENKNKTRDKISKSKTRMAIYISHHKKVSNLRVAIILEMVYLSNSSFKNFKYRIKQKKKNCFILTWQISASESKPMATFITYLAITGCKKAQTFLQHHGNMNGVGITLSAEASQFLIRKYKQTSRAI